MMMNYSNAALKNGTMIKPGMVGCHFNASCYVLFYQSGTVSCLYFSFLILSEVYSVLQGWFWVGDKGEIGPIL